MRVLNRDDSRVMSLAPAGESDAELVTFGVTEPPSAGDYGLLRENGMVWLVERTIATRATNRCRSAVARTKWRRRRTSRSSA